ncbi:MAG: phenylacetate--CoA ligase family protein [Dehalococcoidia bacterium]|nr:phenylacetate--CoA ligase family protein [Dehalococcoidia bacterium]
MEKLPDVAALAREVKGGDGSAADVPAWLHDMDRPYWNMDTEQKLEEFATPRGQERAWARLKRTIRDVYDTSSYWKHRLDEAGVVPEAIKTPEDFARRVPLFDKETHRQSQEDSLAAHGHALGMHLRVPLEQLRLICATSGTSGNPTYYVYDANGLMGSNEVYARALWRTGVRPGMRVLHGFALSMFAAGVPMVHAFNYMGACVIPVGAEAGTERLLLQANLLKPEVLTCTPSYAEYLIEKARAVTGRDIGDFGFKILIVGGEPGGSIPEVRRKLSEAFGAKIYDMQGPAMSCDANEGFHMSSMGGSWYELLDPDTKELRKIEHGATGEWVTTSLSAAKGVAPVLRMAVGDLYQVFTEPCACGKSGWRYRIVGRVDDMLKVKGVMVYPAAITKVIQGMYPKVTGAYRIVLDEPPPRVVPPLKLKIEYGEQFAGADESAHTALVNEIEERMHNALKIRPAIELLPPETLDRSVHKSQVFERTYQQS